MDEAGTDRGQRAEGGGGRRREAASPSPQAEAGRPRPPAERQKPRRRTAAPRQAQTWPERPEADRGRQPQPAPRSSRTSNKKKSTKARPEGACRSHEAGDLGRRRRLSAGRTTRSRSSSRPAAPAGASSRGGSPRAGSRRTSRAEDAAIREVREETGLLAEIEASLGETRYFYVWENVRIRKTVHFFLMRHTGRRHRRSRRRDGGDPLVPARARAQARRVPRRARRARAGRRAAAMTPRDVAIGDRDRSRLRRLLGARSASEAGS